MRRETQKVNAELAKKIEEMAARYVERREWYQQFSKEEKDLAKTNDLRSKAYIMELEQNLFKARANLENSQQKNKMKDAVAKERLGRMGDHVASLEVQVQVESKCCVKLSGQLKEEEREVLQLQNMLTKSQDRFV